MEYFNQFIQTFSDRKKAMGLTCPGPLENLHKEARSVSVSHFLFEGGKLDLGKMLSNNFQLSHSFNLGSSQVAPSYHLGSVFVGTKHFMQGMVDGKGDVQGKYHYTLNDSLIGKAQIQLSHRPGYSMYQVESDYLGDDYAVNVRAINANPAENTGIYMASYLQSITAKLALGVEGVLQRLVPDMEEAGMSLFARYGIPDKSVLTLTLQNLLGLQASYFHKVSDQVELCSEIHAVLAGPQMEAVASIGSKMEYRQASIRAQLDSLGKIAVFLEERLMGRMAFLISGEIDHLKGKSKFGVGLSIEN